MSRNYPKFLFQHVTTGKSTGRFIVHLMKPRCLLLVEENGSTPGIKFVEAFEGGLISDFETTIKLALKWYLATHRKVDEGAIDLMPSGLHLKDAYRSLYNERGIYKLLGLDRSTVSNIRKNMTANIFPTDNLMKSHLEKCRWIRVGTELWSKINIE